MNHTQETPPLVDILYASEKLLQPLRQQIADHNHTVGLPVHVLFKNPTPSEILTYPPYKLANHYFMRCRQKEFPLIFFEEHDKYHYLPQIFSLNHNNSPIYLVATRESDPHPIHPTSWPGLIERFKKMGVQRAILGGMYLWLDDTPRLSKRLSKREWGQAIEKSNSHFLEGKARALRWFNQGFSPQGCVGHLALQLLAGGIDFSLSPLCFPGYKSAYWSQVNNSNQ